MSFKKILVIKFRSLGDTIMITAPLGELRKAFPDAEIHVALIADWAPLFKFHPSIDRIWTYERDPRKLRRAPMIASLALQLRKEKYDAVVNFHAGPSSSAIALATGAKIRSIHFHGHKDKNRYSTVKIPDKGVIKPIIERDMDTIRALGLEIPTGTMPSIHVLKEEMDEALGGIQRLGLSTPVLSIGLGASRPTKSWPIERYVGLAISWYQKMGGSVLALAGPSEPQLAHEFLKVLDDHLQATFSETAERGHARSKITAQAGLPLRTVAALLKHCKVFAGNDSGLKHLAVAVGTPTVTVFGPEHPFEWHPYPRDRHPYFFIENLACRRDARPGNPPWCGLHVCKVENHRCMREIGVDQVLEACKNL